jgi:hypothetical protein
MKLVQINVHFEYTEVIDQLLARHQVSDYVRYPMVEGKDRDGKHFGSQVFPGSVTVFHAQVAESHLAPLWRDLRTFRDQRPAHAHIQALVLPIEERL